MTPGEVLAPGTRVGRYEVELLLGEGRVGRVYLARDPVLGRPVAIKVLRGDPALGAEQRAETAERFRDEARAAAMLAHPALVTIFDLGDREDATPYMVEELVRGPTLRERLHEGALTPAEVAALARGLGGALSQAHAVGLVHGGVRPENVMLAATGAKLADFGTSLCAPAPVGCRAPEERASVGATPASDTFALAVTLYEALTGRRPFDDDPDVAAPVSARRHSPALRGRLGVDAVFARAFARAPSRRFASCELLGATLAAELEGPSLTFLATPGPARSSLARATRRHQNTLILVALGVIVTLLLAGRFQRAGTTNSATKALAPRAPAAQRVVAAADRAAASLSTGGFSSAPPAPSATSTAPESARGARAALSADPTSTPSGTSR